MAKPLKNKSVFKDLKEIFAFQQPIRFLGWLKKLKRGIVLQVCEPIILCSKLISVIADFRREYGTVYLFSYARVMLGQMFLDGAVRSGMLTVRSGRNSLDLGQF